MGRLATGQINVVFSSIIKTANQPHSLFQGLGQIAPADSGKIEKEACNFHGVWRNLRITWLAMVTM